MFNLNQPTVPILEYQKARQAHKALGREDRFLAHMHCTHNQFIRHVLKLRQYGRCPACGKLISPESPANVHHLSYSRYCGLEQVKSNAFFLETMA